MIGSRTRRQLLGQARVRTPRAITRSRPHGQDREVIVSLTSYPARIEVTWQALTSLLRQNVRADRLVLVLFEGDFEGRRLPRSIQRCQSAGAEVLWSPRNARSHLKLLPVMSAFPEALIVTADDDTLYPYRWLSALLDAHRTDPDAIWSHRAHEMVPDDSGRLSPYNSWPSARIDTPWQRVFPTGVGGVLYPPACFAPEAHDLSLALELCPTADDVWFKAMSLRRGTRTRVLRDRVVDPTVVLRSQDAALMHVNVERSANDLQLERTLSWFDLWPCLTAGAGTSERR